MSLASRTLSLAAILTLMLSLTGAVQADEESGSDPAVDRNVQITITIGDFTEGTPPTLRTYRLMTRDGAGDARLLMGWRTPLPTSRDGEEVSYIYQNVGMTASMRSDVVSDGMIVVAGVLEISGTRSEMEGFAAPTDMPLIGTFQQDLNVLLREGQALRVAEVPDHDGGTFYLELTAEVLER